jgi:hypothetical protein
MAEYDRWLRSSPEEAKSFCMQWNPCVCFHHYGITARQQDQRTSVK